MWCPYKTGLDFAPRPGMSLCWRPSWAAGNVMTAGKTGRCSAMIQECRGEWQAIKDCALWRSLNAGCVVVKILGLSSWTGLGLDPAVPCELAVRLGQVA